MGQSFKAEEYTVYALRFQWSACYVKMKVFGWRCVLRWWRERDRGFEVCVGVCVSERLQGGGRFLVGSTWPQTVPLPAPELLLTSDSGAPTASDWLLLPLTYARFLIAGEMFMLHVSSSELGAFTDGPVASNWRPERGEGAGEGMLLSFLAGCLHLSFQRHVSHYSVCIDGKWNLNLWKEADMEQCNKGGNKKHIYKIWCVNRNHNIQLDATHTLMLVF